MRGLAASIEAHRSGRDSMSLQGELSASSLASSSSPSISTFPAPPSKARECAGLKPGPGVQFKHGLAEASQAAASIEAHLIGRDSMWWQGEKFASSLASSGSSSSSDGSQSWRDPDLSAFLDRVIGGSGPTQGAEILAGHRDLSDRWPPATRPGRARRPPRAGARAVARAALVAKSVEFQLPKGRAAVAKASGCKPWAQQAETELGPGDWDIEEDDGSESTRADSSECQSDLSMSEKHSGDSPKRSDVSSDCLEGTTRARPRAKVIVSL